MTNPEQTGPDQDYRGQANPEPTGPDQDYQDQDYRDQGAFEEAEEGRRRDDRVRGASGGPEDPDDMAAADGLTATDDEASAYREHTERGAHQEGEGAPNF